MSIFLQRDKRRKSVKERPGGRSSAQRHVSRSRTREIDAESLMIQEEWFGAKAPSKVTNVLRLYMPESHPDALILQNNFWCKLPIVIERSTSQKTKFKPTKLSYYDLEQLKEGMRLGSWITDEKRNLEFTFEAIHPKLSTPLVDNSTNLMWCDKVWHFSRFCNTY